MGFVERKIAKLAGYLTNRGLRVDAEEQFDPKTMAENAKRYIDSIGLSEGVKCELALDNYMKTELSGLKQVKIDADEEGKNGVTLHKKLSTKGAEETKAELDKAMNVFSTEENSEDVRFASQFQERIKSMNNLIKTVPPKFSTEAFASYLMELKGDVEKRLNDKHTERKKNVEQLFEKSDFVNKLATTLTTDIDGVKKVKDDLLKAMDESHQKELSNFTKNGLDKDINNLHEANRKEFERIAILAKHYHENEKVKEYIDNKNTAKGVSVEINGDNETALLKDITMEELMKVKDPKTQQGILTTTGSWSIFRNKIQSTDDGSVTIKLNRLFQTDDSVYEELTSLAEIVKATGADSIALTIKHKNPVEAEEIARKFVESAIRAGFAPDKISATVNGKPSYYIDSKTGKAVDEIFKEEHGERIRAARQLHEKREAKMNSITGNFTKKDEIGKENDAPNLASLKEAVEKGRLASKSAKETEATPLEQQAIKIR